MSKFTINYNCKCCDAEFEVEVEATPYVPAQIYGPPESCYPAEGGEIELTDTGACPTCGEEVSMSSVQDIVLSKLEQELEPED